MSLATPFSRTGRILKYHNEDVFLAGNGAAFTYRYSFERLRSGVRRLRLVNEANGANLLFEERAWYIPPTMAAAASTATELAMT